MTEKWTPFKIRTVFNQLPDLLVGLRGRRKDPFMIPPHILARFAVPRLYRIRPRGCDCGGRTRSGVVLLLVVVGRVIRAWGEKQKY